MAIHTSPEKQFFFFPWATFQTLPCGHFFILEHACILHELERAIHRQAHPVRTA